MAEYGFEAQNNSGSVTISSSFPALIYSERGQIVVQNTSVVDRDAYGAVTFTKSVLQQAPPKIFMRFNSGRHNSCNCYVSLVGAPGNWTGFEVRAAALGGGTLPRHVFDYVVCKLSDDARNQEYGMMVYNALGVPIFKSQDRVVRYKKFTKKWSMESYYYTTYTPIEMSIEDDDYIEVASFNRGITYQCLSTTMFNGVYLWRDGARTLQVTSQLSNWLYDPADANFNYCIPICKFPVSQYP